MRMRGALEALSSRLDEHNFGEERVLYPKINQRTRPEERSDLTGQLESARLPAEWVCQACPGGDEDAGHAGPGRKLCTGEN